MPQGLLRAALRRVAVPIPSRYQLIEARVCAQIVDARVNACVCEADRVLLLGFFKPCESSITLIQKRVDDGDFVSGDPVLATLGYEVFENLARFSRSTACGKDMRLLGAGGRRVAGKCPLLLVNGER